jgi:hypothetical protein
VRGGGIEQVLGGDMSFGEQSGFERHLDRCATCWVRLREQTAGKEQWDESFGCRSLGCLNPFIQQRSSVNYLFLDFRQIFNFTQSGIGRLLKADK